MQWSGGRLREVLIAAMDGRAGSRGIDRAAGTTIRTTTTTTGTGSAATTNTSTTATANAITVDLVICLPVTILRRAGGPGGGGRSVVICRRQFP